MAASAPQPAAKVGSAYKGPLAIEIGCQFGVPTCGYSAIYLEPYVSYVDPTYVLTPANDLFFGSGGLAVQGEIDTCLTITGVCTYFYPLTYSATWLKDPFPGDFGIHPIKTLSVTMFGLVEFYYGSTFLGSDSATVSLYCQNLNGQLVFLNTHPDLSGSTVSGALTDLFSAVVSCAT